VRWCGHVVVGVQDSWADVEVPSVTRKPIEAQVAGTQFDARVIVKAVYIELRAEGQQIGSSTQIEVAGERSGNGKPSTERIGQGFQTPRPE